ncbi:MAG: hypothetical protein AAFU41_20775, partial [Pseudomonadota bacterium]
MIVSAKSAGGCGEWPESARVVGDLAGRGLKRTVGIGGSMSIDCSTMTTDAAAPMSDCVRAGEWLA